jgi:hypothetical protein
VPDFETMDRGQAAVYWPAAGRGNEFGEPQVGAAEEIRVRWVDRKADVLDPAGNTVSLDAQVVTDFRVPPGSRLWKGELADWYGTGSAADDDEVMVAVTAAEATDLKGRTTRYEVGLKRFRDTPR